MFGLALERRDGLFMVLNFVLQKSTIEGRSL